MCPIPAMINGTDLDLTPSPTHKSKKYSTQPSRPTLLRTTQVEGQLLSTYHATQSNVLHLVRKHLTQPIEYEITRGEAQSQHYYHPGRIQDTNYHPSSSIARFNSLALCQTGSITCPWSLMQFGFVICLQKGLIFHCLHFIFTTFIC